MKLEWWQIPFVQIEFLCERIFEPEEFRSWSVGICLIRIKILIRRQEIHVHRKTRNKRWLLLVVDELCSCFSCCLFSWTRLTERDERVRERKKREEKEKPSRLMRKGMEKVSIESAFDEGADSWTKASKSGPDDWRMMDKGFKDLLAFRSRNQSCIGRTDAEKEEELLFPRMSGDEEDKERYNLILNADFPFLPHQFTFFASILYSLPVCLSLYLFLLCVQRDEDDDDPSQSWSGIYFLLIMKILPPLSFRLFSSLYRLSWVSLSLYVFRDKGSKMGTSVINCRESFSLIKSGFTFFSWSFFRNFLSLLI